MKASGALFVVLGALLPACAGRVPAPVPAVAHPKNPAVEAAEFSFAQLGEFIQRTSAADGSAQAELGRLLALSPRTPADRLKLAWLLATDAGAGDELARAQEQLEGLAPLFADPATRRFVRLLERTVAAERALKQEKKKFEETQEKLRQLKKLELELQERNRGGQGK